MTDMFRAGLLVAAITLSVLGAVVWSEVDYARFAAEGARGDARIVRVEPVRSGRRIDYCLHYELVLDGKTRRFDDRDDRQRLDDLYTVRSTNSSPRGCSCLVAFDAGRRRAARA